MGLSNFTGRGDDDTNSPSGPAGPNPLAGLMSAPASDQPNSVDDMLVNYNEKFVNAEPTLFRDQLIEQVLSVLIGKNKSNALLVGPAGVGKTKIAEDIARRIVLSDPLIPDQLKGYTIFELPISSLVAGSSLVGALEQKVKDIVEYASEPANKAILFMDEVHQLTNGSDSGTYAKIAQILKPALARGDMQVIGATTTQEARSLDDDPAFKRRFSRLVVDELNAEQTATILGKVRPGLVAHYQHQITVGDDVLDSVVRVADQNTHAGAHRPDSAITLLDRAMADRVLEQKRLITTALGNGDTVAAQALQSIPKVPLTENRVLDVARRMLTGNTARHVFDVPALSSTLKQHLYGQDDVLDQLTDCIAREELNLFPRTAPIAWLFAGASGVGKTETAKHVAEQMTGQDPIILNMSEYNDEASINRLIGSPAGYVGSDSNAELPFDSLESNPHRLILLDEFEKANIAVQRLFLQAFDEGVITTARGKPIDFSKATIVATTNAARESLDGAAVGFTSGPQKISHQSLNKALSQFFEAELLGRFSLIVGFNPITGQTYRSIVAAYYERARDRIVEARPKFASSLPAAMPAEAIETLLEESFIASQGARPAERAVRVWIEDRLLGAHTQQPAAAVTAPADAALNRQEES
ncbi:AAA family ATPase [Arthrobacter castelli]|uniref:AAA family ATPase n=1 Tax=Arthrobacter castelli TaxID=271431 RepID=UPI0003FF15E4|nr:AAA family ATPase [Arthrobacter castelli]